MKIALSVLFLLATLAGLSISCSNDSWHQFKLTFNKQYDTVEEETQRRTIFCENLKKIMEHNKRYKNNEVTWEMGVNQFADWTHEEFVKWVKGVPNGVRLK